MVTGHHFPQTEGLHGFERKKQNNQTCDREYAFFFIL